MDNVVVLEAPQHVKDGVRLADVGQKLVPKPLSLAGSFTGPAMSTISTVVGTVF